MDEKIQKQFYFGVVEFSPDGSLIAAGEFGWADRPRDVSKEEWEKRAPWYEIALWDVKERRIRTRLKGHHIVGPSELRFDPEGKLLASVGAGEIKIWRVQDAQLVSTIQYDADAIAFTPDAKALIAIGPKSSLKAWDTSSWRERWSTNFSEETDGTSLAVSPGGKLALVGTRDGEIVICDLQKALEIIRLKAHLDGVRHVLFSRSGKWAASAGKDKRIVIWTTDRWEPWRVLDGHTDEVVSCIFGPDEKILISVGLDKTIRFWDTATGAPIHGKRGP